MQDIGGHDNPGSQARDSFGVCEEKEVGSGTCIGGLKKEA